MVLGLGFYAVPSWPVVLLSVGLLLFLLFRKTKGGPWSLGFLVLGVTVLTALPTVLARLGPGGMSHFQDNFEPSRIPHSIVAYLQGFFWDGRPGFPFGPNSGGILDPVLGALALLGILKARRAVPAPVFGGVMICFGLGLLPGVLSNSLELYRIDHAMPWAYLAAAFGVQALLTGRGKLPAWKRALPLLLLPLTLDAANYATHYCAPEPTTAGNQWRSPKYSRAFRILQGFASSDRPVDLFTEFSMDYDNKTLNLAAYGLDALQGAAGQEAPPAWAALLMKVDYAPYLTSAYPGTRVFPLPPDSALEEKLPFALFLIPTPSLGEKNLRAWERADRTCRDVNYAIKDKAPNRSWRDYAGVLAKDRELFRNDPFLSTVLAEKCAFFFFVSGDLGTASGIYRDILKRGIRTAHVENNLALCQSLMSGKSPQ
jgi:hypothetical protein